MSSPLSLWQEFALVGLAVVSFFHALVFRVWSGRGIGADGVFALAIAALVTVVTVPSVFDTAGARIVEWSPLPEALDAADARTAELAALPGRLIEGALERLGFGPDTEDAPEVDVEEAPGSASPDAPDGETGWLAAQIRPSVEGLVALLVRVATAAMATLVLLLAILLRIVTGLARRLRRIGERLEALEASTSSPAEAAPGRGDGPPDLARV
jgi:hypothetical protein